MEIISKYKVQWFGKGDRVFVLAHGFGSNRHLWYEQINFLKNYGRVMVFEHLGSGNTYLNENPENYKNLDFHVNNVIEILEGLELKQVIFISHSFSGAIALKISIMRPELINQVVTIGFSACYRNIDDYIGGFSNDDIKGLFDSINHNYENWIDHFAKYALSDVSAYAEEILVRSFSVLPKEIAINTAMAVFYLDIRDILSKIDKNVLIIQSVNDPIVPNSAAKFIANNIKNSTLKLVESKGHFPHFTSSEKVNEFIKEYCNL